MIAYHFRVLSDGLPNGWVGFAFANNLQELFWQIDNHADPYRVEIKKAHSGSCCVLQINNGDDYYDETDTEITGHVPYDIDDDWKTPKWVTDPDFEV